MRRKCVLFAPLLLVVGCGTSTTTSALTLPDPHDDAGGAARRGDGGGGVLEAAAPADVAGELPPAAAGDAGAELQPAAGDAGAEAAPQLCDTQYNYGSTLVATACASDCTKALCAWTPDGGVVPLYGCVKGATNGCIGYSTATCVLACP